MATTVGAAIHSDELVVAQSDKIAPGTEVQTLVIEFDQSKYEEFLSSRASSPVKTRKCRRVSYETSAPVASAESSRSNLESQSSSLKDKAPQQVKRWVVKQPKPTSGAISQVVASAIEPRPVCVKEGPAVGPLSRRAIQRQRQNQARRRARALVSFDGFHYRQKGVKLAEGRADEEHNEPRPRTPSSEPLLQQGVHSKQGECRPHNEPRFQHEVRSKQGKPRPNGEPRHQHEPRRQNRMRSRPRQARQPLSRGSRLCEVQFSESTGGTPSSDLRDYLTLKSDVNQMQSRCCCEKLVSAMMAQCPMACQPTVFEPRRFRHKKQTPRNGHSHGVTINMVGRSRSKTLTDSPESFDPEYSSRLLGALIDSQGVYQHTRIRTGAAIPFDYQQLAGGTREEFENSGIATSQPSNTDMSDRASVHMADKKEEMAKKIEEQQALILAQQESIKRLEVMMEKLAGKKKVDEDSSKSRHGDNKEDHDTYYVSSKTELNHRDHTLYDFQKQLDALKLQAHFKELGVTRPYPPEWDDVPYPPKFKPLDLVQFDGKSSPSQHIYYFQAQTGHIVGNDPIVTRLFIGALKGVAFEWFRRLEPGSITCWKDMERLFMARFFDDDTGVSMATLLATKQQNTESVSNFVKRFRNRSLRTHDQISEATLIEMCRNNLSIDILSNMGAVESRSWKDLIRQGEQVESMLKRIDAEELHEFRDDDDQDNFIPHTHAKGKDTLVIATTSPSKSSSR